MSPALLQVAPYAALLTLIYIALSIRVARMRVHFRMPLGIPADNDKMLRAIRLQGNFSEYVPLALVLMTLAALLGASPAFIHILGIVLVLSRLLHIYSLAVFEPTRRRHVLRPIAMLGSWFVLLTAALFLLWQWLQFSF